MMMEMFQILLQAVFTFFALLLLTRILGKKQMSHLTFFNIIKKGRIMEKVLQDMRLNLDDVSMLLRSKDVFSVADVEYGILEPNGSLSILKKAEKETVTRQDMNIQPQNPNHLPTEIITDGKLVQRNLRELNLDRGWVEQQLRMQGIHSIEKVFYAEIQKDGSLYINPRE